MQELDSKNDPKHAQDTSGDPKFGRLLIVLAFVVAIVVALTFGSLAYYT